MDTSPSSSSSSSSSSSASSSIPNLIALPFTSPPSNRTFTLFPQLPTEIRAAVWKMTLLPRVVEMRYHGISSDQGFTSLAEPPVALRVCKESRELVIDLYPLCFGSIYHPAHTRFNLSMDILVLGSDFEDFIPHFLGILNERELSKLRYLAIESDILTVFPFRDMKTPLKRALANFSGLKELLIVQDVAEMKPLIHTDEDSFMTIYEELPTEIEGCKELHTGTEAISWLPTQELLDEMEVWSTPKCHPVYGWRRCTCTKVLDSDSEEDSDGDEDEEDYWEDDDYDSDDVVPADLFPPGFSWTGY
ncbi:hypothetical protein LARI1_G003841 [Lachnellula arida]|uniref:2EXR domain-containing protein n=1 Tax=Lachnellula arida TaxID=1316785 RepID=A0A8T9BFN0_9HELO|nr:hypothetical protein LARI1_G003841 [Lachnellula arida]